MSVGCRVSIQYQFHSVGQGLFASGRIETNEPVSRKFLWVYDCGTVSSQRYLTKALDSARLGAYVDLVTISHFDKDHISGMVTLLMQSHVQDLMLPFMPLWQRLILMIEQGVTPQDQLGRFLMDPVGFISTIPRAKVKRILFVTPTVPPQERGSPPDPSEDEPSTNRRAKNGVFSEPAKNGGTEPAAEERFTIDADLVNDAVLPIYDERRRYKEETRGASIEIQYITEGSSLTVADQWEFVPYNDGRLAGVSTQHFRDQVETLRTTLLCSQNALDAEVALYELTKVYVKFFGTSAKERNVISLFLYAGPIDYGHLVFREAEATCYQAGKESTTWLRYISRLGDLRRGILSTGDGYLEKKSRFDCLSEHLGEKRLKRISVLQVMHHGSENNWFSGVAAKFSPDFSVFCSDPSHQRNGHPHAEVLRDFWRFNPIQVDKQSSFQYSFYMYWKR